MFYHPISMQAQKPVRDDIVAPHKVASVLVNGGCGYVVITFVGNKIIAVKF